MKKIYVALPIIILLFFASCAKNIEEVQPLTVISEEVVEQAKKELLNPKVFTLNATKWEYDQKEIRVKQGEKLIIKVNNTDTIHGIAIPDMQLVGDEEIIVDTSVAGEFEFRCSNYCGEGHQEMTGILIIE